jgi:hypothetical protein
MEDKALKIGFGFLAFFAIIFGITSISQNIKLSFNPGFIESESSEQNNLALEEIRKRLFMDSQEGVLGLDEIFYSYSELQENCPEGEDCGISVSQSQAEDFIEGQINALGEGIDQETMDILESIWSGAEPTAQDIRTLLGNSGIPKSELDAVSDQELVNLFKEIAQ